MCAGLGDTNHKIHYKWPYYEDRLSLAEIWISIELQWVSTDGTSPIQWSDSLVAARMRRSMDVTLPPDSLSTYIHAPLPFKSKRSDPSHGTASLEIHLSRYLGRGAVIIYRWVWLVQYEGAMVWVHSFWGGRKCHSWLQTGGGGGAKRVGVGFPDFHRF